MELQCPYNWFHNGGNDANFTLRALLLLAVRSYDQADKDDWLNILDEAARTPLPLCSPGEEDVLAKQKAQGLEERKQGIAKRREKKAKRCKNTRKYQSRLWSVEEQEEIRAERAAKRRLKEEQAATRSWIVATALSDQDAEKLSHL